LESLGFVREGVVRQYLEIDGKRRDHILLALLAGELANGAAHAGRDPMRGAATGKSGGGFGGKFAG
jgi:hypothetical protein